MVVLRIEDAFQNSGEDDEMREYKPRQGLLRKLCISKRMRVLLR